MSKIIKLSDRVNQGSHSNEDYKEAIQRFTGYIESKKLKLKEDWSSFDMAVTIWNSSNMEKHLPPDALASGLPYSGFFEDEEMALVEELVSYRWENFPTLDKFLKIEFQESMDLFLEEAFPKLEAVDYDKFMENAEKIVAEYEQSEDFRLPFGDFFGEFDDDDEYEDDDDDDDEEEDLFVLNREAIIAIPKQAFVEWLNKPIHGKLKFEELSPQVFMINDTIDDFQKWKKKNGKFLFTEIFGSWTPVEFLWPKKQTLAELEKYFELKHAPEIFDSSPGAPLLYRF